MPFLLDEQPRFVDFDLFGMLENFLYSGHYKLPAAPQAHPGMASRMAGLKIQMNGFHPIFANAVPPFQPLFTREKLHSRHQRPPPRPQFPAQLRGQQRPDSHRSHRGNRPLQARIHRTGPERAHRFADARRLSRRGQPERRREAAQRRQAENRFSQKRPRRRQRRRRIFNGNTVDNRILSLAAGIQKAQPKNADDPRQQGHQPAHQGRRARACRPRITRPTACSSRTFTPA